MHPLRRLSVSLLVAGALLVPTRASAFCGFYVSGADAKLFNNATQVVMMRDGTRTVLSMQNNYQGPPQNFAMVVPVPVVLQKENVKTLPKDIFARVDQLSAPRLVEYWEQDPCAPEPVELKKVANAPAKAAPRAGAAKADDHGVTIEAQFTVGEYEVVVLSAKDSGGLDKWLAQEHYQIPSGSEPYLRPYVQSGSKFFVAKVDVTKVTFENGMATLSPLRFHYDSETFQLPIRLGLVNASGAQDLIVNILARGQRYEVANYPNATIPTNFDVAESAKGQFGTFYAALFDRTLATFPKAVVTEYAWDAGTCDPCPSPALRPDELATLGGDVLGPGPVRSPGMPIPPSRGAPSRPPPMRRGSASGFVLTRLHARYTKESLGEDLIFRAAPPIVGGREVTTAPGVLEHGSSSSSVNNFQGRYAVRHPWTGPVACKDPRRGIWGGPPGGAPPRPTPATNLAFAPRGKVELASFVKGAIPEIALLPGAVENATPVADAGAPSVPTTDAGLPGTPPAPKRGCGCVVPGASAPAPFGLALTAAGAALGWFRRRKRA